MGIWQKIKSKVKSWFGGGGNKKKSAPRPRAVSNNRDARNQTVSSNTRSTFNKRELLNSLKEQKKEEDRVKEAFKAKTTEYKSLADASKSDRAEKRKGLENTLNADKNKLKEIQDYARKNPQQKKNTATPDPKIDAAKKSRAEMRRKLDAKKQENKEWHEVTNNRFNVGEKGISGEERKRRQQNVKSQTYDEKTAVKEAEHQMKWHGKEMSFARGALSGATFGASDFAAKKLTKGEARKAEEVYQQNKSKGWETAGEIAGSLASFGLTAGATEKAAVKAGQAAGKLAPKTTGKVMSALAKRVGEERAKKIAATVGTDILQNATTGLLYDFNRASTEYEIGSDDWWKEMGKSAAFNAAITGGVAGVSALRGSRQLAREAAAVAKNDGVEEAAKESLRRRLKERSATIKGVPTRLGRNADEVIDAAESTNRTVLGNGKEEVAEPAARAAFDEEAYRESLNDVIPFTSDTPTTPKRGLPNSYRSKEENIRALADNEEVPFATVDEAMPSTSPELTAKNELRDGLERRVEKLSEQGADTADDAIKVNDVATDAPISDAPTSGVKQIRSAYEYNNGEKIEDGILTKWNEAWNASKDYSASHAKGEKERMSKVAVSQLNAMDSEAERKLRQQLVDSGDLNYEAISTPEMYDKIAKQMRDDADRWVKDMIDINEGGALDFRNTPEWQARVQYILGTVDPSADAASEIAYTEAFKLAQNISSKGGQVLNLRRNFVHLTPMGKRDAILDDFVNILSKSKGFTKEHPALNSLYKFDRRNYIRKYLMEDDAIRDGVEKLVRADKPDEVSEAFTELMLNVNRKNPKAGFDVLQELRYLNMLGNPKTHIRNIFGSGLFAPMREISNAIRAGIENPAIKYAERVSGNKVDIVKHGGISLTAAKEAVASKPTTKAGQEALEAFNKRKGDLLGSAKLETQLYKGRGKTVAGKMLDAVSDFNSNLLTKEDDLFKQRAFRESYIKSYNRYLKDSKPITDRIRNRLEDEAIQEAQIATFNEYNEMAKFLANITRKASDANASTVSRWGGRAVNAVMPFTKVPANLMKQSLNYSPLGIAKGFAGIKDAAKKGDAKALTKAIDELSSGLAGSAIFGLGTLLGGTTDMFTTNAGKNEPDAKFKKDRGMQNYSINFKDPETGKGVSLTLDWLVPSSAVFFSGVELANQMKKGDFDPMSFGGSWADVVSRLAEPVMETSMLSGLHSMLETMRGGYNGDDTKGAIHILARETAQSYLNSMIPTMLGQASRTAYDTDMQITGDSDWEYFRNQLKSKAGLANTNILGEPLGADTDAYGNVKGEKKDAGDKAFAVLKNFVSPANIQKIDFSQTDEEKLRTYEQAIRDGKDPQDMAYLFPKKQYKKQFSVGGEDVKMSNRELSAYNQAKTTGGQEGMRYILENYMFNRQEYDEKGKKVPSADAYTKEQKAELIKQFEGKSMREVEEWLYAQPEFKNATEAERKRAIKGLWDLSKDSKTVASQRVGEQAVWQAQGKDVNEYNFKNEITEKKRDALQPYVDAGIISYEEAVDFARNAGKTYYTETDDGGTSSTYYNKKEMIEYLVKKGYSYEKAEALYNSFKNSRAKPYSGNSLSSGRGRRGYRRRGWRRRGGGGSTKAPAIKQSAFKASKTTYTDLAKTLKTASSSKSTTAKTASTVKIAPPNVKFKKYEV